MERFKEIFLKRRSILLLIIILISVFLISRFRQITLEENVSPINPESQISVARIDNSEKERIEASDVVFEDYESFYKNSQSLSYNEVLNSETVNSDSYGYHKSDYKGEKIKWLGKISRYYSGINGIKFCIIDDEHKNIDTTQPCDWFWAFAKELMSADDISVNPNWDGSWVDYTLNYYGANNEDPMNQIYEVEGSINGIDCGVHDRCAVDIEIIGIKVYKN